MILSDNSRCRAASGEAAVAMTTAQIGMPWQPVNMNVICGSSILADARQGRQGHRVPPKCEPIWAPPQPAPPRTRFPLRRGVRKPDHGEKTGSRQYGMGKGGGGERGGTIVE